ncbi:MAG TPA: SDR family NAD(P)-dependent oxidoreductase [Candidatus Binatia bacterium]|nr:SDR family NAD(P)-dependent oxidoreductase [Candidatus Binatia bacterium]
MNLGGSRVLVTGAGGFIGSHLVQRLLSDGAHVRALCLYTSTGSRGWLDDLSAELTTDLEVWFGDVRDESYVDQLVKGMDIVFHLAALIAIPYSYIAPSSFIATNVVGTHNVLEAARRHQVRRLVHVSTSEVYGTPDTLPITEQHALKGQSPYSASKIAADKLCEAWACSFGVPVIVLRPFNTYGPRQSARAIIPTVLEQILCGINPLRLGSLEPRRDFTYVTDTVDGLIRAAGAVLSPGEVIHLGTGTSVSVGELVERAQRLLGTQLPVTVDQQRLRPARSEVRALQSDPSRAASLLAWRPTVELDSGLATTAAWLRPRLDPRRAASFQR